MDYSIRIGIGDSNSAQGKGLGRMTELYLMPVGGQDWAGPKITGHRACWKVLVMSLIRKSLCTEKQDSRFSGGREMSLG